MIFINVNNSLITVLIIFINLILIIPFFGYMVKFFKKNRNLIIIFNRVFEVLVNISILLIIKKSY